jgi:hypothetical protein
VSMRPAGIRLVELDVVRLVEAGEGELRGILGGRLEPPGDRPGGGSGEWAARSLLNGDADWRVHVIHHRRAAGTASLEGRNLALDLTRFADLRVRPRALAHLLSSVPESGERALAPLMRL